MVHSPRIVDVVDRVPACERHADSQRVDRASSLWRAACGGVACGRRAGYFRARARPSRTVSYAASSAAHGPDDQLVGHRRRSPRAAAGRPSEHASARSPTTSQRHTSASRTPSTTPPRSSSDRHREARRRRACGDGRPRATGRRAAPRTRPARPAATSSSSHCRTRTSRAQHRDPLDVEVGAAQSDVEPVVEVGQPRHRGAAHGLGPRPGQRRRHLVGHRPHLGVDPSPLRPGSRSARRCGGGRSAPCRPCRGRGGAA